MPHPFSTTNITRRAFDRGILLGRQTLFFEADRGNNGGGTGGDGNGGGGDDRQNLQGLLQRHNNDAMAVVATLLTENHSLRDERRQLRSQIPAQGTVVLNAEQAQQWTGYQQLGTLATVQQQLQAASTAQTELSTLLRTTQIRDAAEATGFKASVLGQLPGVAELTFETRDVTVDGKTTKASFVKDKAGKETPLLDHAKAAWADFLPALQAAQQQSGTTFVQQNAGGGAPGNAIDAALKRFQDQRDAAANPLQPAASVAARSPLA